MLLHAESCETGLSPTGNFTASIFLDADLSRLGLTFELMFSRIDGLLDQRCNCHWAHASRNRRICRAFGDGSGHFNIADATRMISSINNYRPVLDPRTLDKLRLPNGPHKDVCEPNNMCKTLGF